MENVSAKMIMQKLMVFADFAHQTQLLPKIKKDVFVIRIIIGILSKELAIFLFVHNTLN